MSQEKWHQRLIWLIIGAIVTVIIAAIFTPIIGKVEGFLTIKSGATNTPLVVVKLTTTSVTPGSLITPTATKASNPVIPKLRPLYKGISLPSNDLLVWDVKSQDPQGNISLTATYSLLDGSSASPWNCRGTINIQGDISLSCNKTGFAPFSFNGLLYSDGHVEGTETFDDGDKDKDSLKPI